MAFWLYRNKTHPAQQPSPEWQRCPWNCWRSRCTARLPVQWGCPGWDSSFLLDLLRWCGEGRPPKEAHLYRWTPSGKELSGKEHWIVYFVTPRVVCPDLWASWPLVLVTLWLCRWVWSSLRSLLCSRTTASRTPVGLLDHRDRKI